MEWDHKGLVPHLHVYISNCTVLHRNLLTQRQQSHQLLLSHLCSHKVCTMYAGAYGAATRSKPCPNCRVMCDVRMEGEEHKRA